MKWPAVTGFEQLAFGRIFEKIERQVSPGASMVTAYTNGEVTLRSRSTKIGYHEAANMDGYQGVEPGDFVVHGLDILRGSVGISDSAGAITKVCSICRPTKPVDLRFVAHAIRTQARSGFMRAMARGIREGGADFRRWGTLAELPIPFPSLSEQQAIADYLDRETQRIDALTAEQRGLIETLRERRQAVIDDSLDGNEEWGIVPLKHLIERVEQGVSPQAESVPVRDEEWGVLKSGCVNRGIFHENENKRLPDEFRIDESLAVRVGDVLVSRASGSVKFVGSCARVRNIGHRLILSDKTFRLVLRENVDADFLVWLLNSRVYREQVRLAVSGAQGLANNLPLSSLRTFTFHVPSTADEQREVATYLGEQTSRIDALIAESEDLIALSEERRATLITAAVTGQIDVRTAA